jgi:hypothetical protein
MSFRRSHLLVFFICAVSFSNSNAQTFTIAFDTVRAVVDTCVPATLHDDVTASGAPSTLRWSVTASDFPADWYTASGLGIKDNSAAYSNAGLSLWNGTTGATHSTTYSPPGPGQFSLFLDMSSTTTPGTHWMKIHLQNLTTLAFKDAVFVITRIGIPDAGAITGPQTLCMGGTDTLSESLTSGVWGISNGHATFGTIAGHNIYVSGSSPGIDTISYTVFGVCRSGIAIKTVSVVPLPPPAITSTGSTLLLTTPYVLYQWYAGFTAIAGATNATYTPTANGLYYVEVTGTAGCSVFSSAFNFYSMEVREANAEAQSITLYPNPAHNELIISGAGTIEEVAISNMAGQTIFQTNHSTANAHIDISHWPAGLYLVRINGSDVRRFLKE